MTTKVEGLRIAITTLTALLAVEEGKPSGSYLGALLPGFDADAAEKQRLLEIAESIKPHAWRDAGPGVPISMVGDNDGSIEMDDLLRAFGPFMTLAENANFGKLPDDAVVKDSTGKPFHRITIKRRAGLGRQAVGVLRDEVRAIWYSAWGQATRADPLNVNHIPKPEIVHMLFDKVY